MSFGKTVATVAMNQKKRAANARWFVGTLRARCGFLVVLFLASVVFPSIAQAVSVNVRAWPHQGYGRLVFDWPQPVTYQMAQDGNTVTLNFSAPIEPNLTSVYEVMGDYLTGVALGSDGMSLALFTSRDVTLNSFQNGNNIVVDLRDSAGTARAQPVAIPGGQPAVAPASTAAAAADNAEPASSEASPVESAQAPSAQTPPTQDDTPAPPGATEPAATPASPSTETTSNAAAAVTPPSQNLPLLNVRTGQHPTYNRLVFDWEQPVTYQISRSGNVVTIDFDQAARTNIEQLDLSRTPFFAGPQQGIADGKLRIMVGVPASGQIRDMKVGNKVVVDVLAQQGARAEAPPVVAVAAPQAEQPTPVETQIPPLPEQPLSSEVQPDTAALPSTPFQPEVGALGPRSAFGRVAEGVVASPEFTVNMTPIPGGLRIMFEWPVDVAAAVFPRAGYYWVAFDKPGRASFPQPQEALTKLVPIAEQVAARRGTALRFLVAGGLRPSIARDGAHWEIIFRRDGGRPQSSIPVVPDSGADNPRIFMPVADAAERVDFTDPEVGDEVQVIPVSQAAAGVAAPRDFIEFQILPTVQGVAVVPFSEAVYVQPRRNGAQIVSENGLILSPPLGEQIAAVAQERDLQTDKFPDVEGDTYKFRTWQRVNFDRYQDELKDLLRVISRAPSNGRSVARRDLALFLFAHGLNAEAIGVLNRINDQDPTFYLTDQLQQVSGAAYVLMNRPQEAEKILFRPRFDQDNEVALFRGLHYAQQGQWDRALPYLAQGEDMIDFFPLRMRGMFRLAFAEANIRMNNPNIVGPIVEDILDEEMPIRYHDQARYLDALAQAELGQWDSAFGMLEQLAISEDRWTAARARLSDIRFKVAQDQLSLTDAVENLEQMRFAWRGGDFELGLVRDLANYHYLNGDYRESLLTMRQTLGNFTGHPEAATVANEMNGVFEELYLGGRADELPPVRALALYQDFRELTPVGDKGDQMIRYLTDRLVQVDLLDQAADLLKHQLDFRLSGSRRAEVARQLAVIYLLNRQPREALRTIRATEFSELPQLIRRQRRHLEARALADMDRFDDALSLLASDQSREAEMLRADIAWRAKEWKNVARYLASLLNQKFEDSTQTLNRRDREWLLQSAVALNMAGDREGLERLRRRWTDKLDGSVEAATFASLTEVVDPSALSFRELAPAIAGVQGLEAFMSSYRERLRAGGLSAIN